MAKLDPSTKYSEEEQGQGGSGAHSEAHQHHGHGHGRPPSAAVQVQVFTGAAPPPPSFVGTTIAYVLEFPSSALLPLLGIEPIPFSSSSLTAARTVRKPGSGGEQESSKRSSGASSPTEASFQQLHMSSGNGQPGEGGEQGPQSAFALPPGPHQHHPQQLQQQHPQQQHHHQHQELQHQHQQQYVSPPSNQALGPRGGGEELPPQQQAPHQHSGAESSVDLLTPATSHFRLTEVVRGGGAGGMAPQLGISPEHCGAPVDSQERGVTPRDYSFDRSVSASGGSTHRLMLQAAASTCSSAPATRASSAGEDGLQLPDDPHQAGDRLASPSGTKAKADYHHARGYAFRKQGKFEAAIEEYTQAINLDPRHFKALFNRGFSHDKVLWGLLQRGGEGTQGGATGACFPQPLSFSPPSSASLVLVLNPLRLWGATVPVRLSPSLPLYPWCWC